MREGSFDFRKLAKIINRDVVTDNLTDFDINNLLLQRFKLAFDPIRNFPESKRLLFIRSNTNFVDTCFKGLESNLDAQRLRAIYLKAMNEVLQ